MTLEIVGGGIKPPIAIINHYSTAPISDTGYELANVEIGAKIYKNTAGFSATYEEVLNIADGHGYIKYLFVRNLHSSIVNTGIKLLLDGVNVFENIIDANPLNGFHVIGSGHGGAAELATTFSKEAFNKSLSLSVYSEAGAAADKVEAGIIYSLT